jgi:endonuclease YncB( thermonuclease family)
MTAFDPGYGTEPYTTLVREAPGREIFPPADFRVEWGPVFHRGRLDGTARVLALGQDPAAHEAIARRILVGEAGQRVQVFLRRLGITRSYVMINAFLYSFVSGGSGTRHSDDPSILAYRNRWLNALLRPGGVEVVVAFGEFAHSAYQAWLASPPAEGRDDLAYAQVTHPTHPESTAGYDDPGRLAAAHQAMLRNWNDALRELYPQLAHRDVAGGLELFDEQAAPPTEPIPEEDLPAGCPPFMRGLTTWARREGRATIVVTIPSDERPWLEPKRGDATATAITRSSKGLVMGHARLGRYGQGRGSVEQLVSDGDTVAVEADGNLSVRFLGVDAPEVRSPLPGTTEPFVAVDDPRWIEVLSKPFAGGRGAAFDIAVDEALVEYLADQVGPGTAENHARLAKAAASELRRIIRQDMTTLGRTEDNFRFFLAFAGEVTDYYGRLLTFLHPDQPNTPAEQRMRSYNERMLAAGWASPYFIWPNINPFRRAETIADAIPQPGTAADLAANDSSLCAARAAVAAARREKIGIYDAGQPLKLLPFELRFLARRQPPDRWLIDLSDSADTIIPPQSYIGVPLPEDRLFVPAQYVPLWVEHGWRRG